MKSVSHPAAPNYFFPFYILYNHLVHCSRFPENSCSTKKTKAAPNIYYIWHELLYRRKSIQCMWVFKEVGLLSTSITILNGIECVNGLVEGQTKRLEALKSHSANKLEIKNGLLQQRGAESAHKARPAQLLQQALATWVSRELEIKKDNYLSFKAINGCITPCNRP